jgi:hypothetical protein
MKMRSGLEIADLLQAVDEDATIVFVVFHDEDLLALHEFAFQLIPEGMGTTAFVLPNRSRPEQVGTYFSRTCARRVRAATTRCNVERRGAECGAMLSTMTALK